LLARARARYPELDPELVEQLCEEAVAAVADRVLPDLRRRLLAGHVKLAQLASGHVALYDRQLLLTAPPRSEAVLPADHALAEHLHAVLDEDELLVAAVRGARKVPSRIAARALNLGPAELRELERSGLAKAAEMTLAYHENMICEPAALSQADTPAQRSPAVQAHLEFCRSCNSEFWDRAALVLAHAGSMLTPMPELALDAKHRTHRSLGGVRVPWFVRRPRALA
jgi:hypothetical protein